MKKLILSLIVAAASITMHAQDVVLSLGKFTQKSDTVTVELFIKNTKEVSGLQFDITNMSAFIGGTGGKAGKLSLNVMSMGGNKISVSGMTITSAISPGDTLLSYLQFKASGTPVCITGVKAASMSAGQVTAAVKDSCIDVVLGVADRNLDGKTVLAPNPANEQLNVLFGHASASRNIQLIDAYGRFVAAFDAEAPAITINTTSYAPGVYLMRVNNEGETSSQRVIIAH